MAKEEEIKSKARILVIDDDPDIQDLLSNYFRRLEFVLETFSEPIEPLRLLQKEPDRYDLILTDLKMPGMDGVEFVRRAKKCAPLMPIILITAHRSVEAAVEATRAGAYDFVIKPINLAQLNLSIERGLRVRTLERDNEALRREVRSGWTFEGVVGKSPAIRAVFDLAKRVSKSTANVLITGESGTGKEVIARAIHQHGLRKDAPFVAINCSAIPDNLLESELFGHAKGAFTGAIEKKLGLFEEANGGVLFLDEIGDMDVGLQTKLLRVLQERKVKRIGENQDRPIDVRVIAATHRDLTLEIEAKKFREDLFYRLCVIPIQIPPLRQRTEDIVPLADFFLERFRIQNESEVTGFTRAAIERLMSLPWKGNVRELENAIERAVVLSTGVEIDAGDLPDPSSVRTQPGTSLSAEITKPVSSTPAPTAKRPDFLGAVLEESRLMSLEELNQRYIEHVLKVLDGAKEKAASVLGIDRKTLYRRIRSAQTAAEPEATALPKSEPMGPAEFSH